MMASIAHLRRLINVLPLPRSTLRMLDWAKSSSRISLNSVVSIRSMTKSCVKRPPNVSFAKPISHDSCFAQTRTFSATYIIASNTSHRTFFLVCTDFPHFYGNLCYVLSNCEHRTQVSHNSQQKLINNKLVQ